MRRTPGPIRLAPVVLPPLVAVLMLAPACVQAQGAPAIPFLPPAAQTQIERRYFPGNPHKALAITEAGGWGAAIDMASLEEARSTALTQCRRSNRRHPCFLAWEDDASVLDANHVPAVMDRLAMDLLRAARPALVAYGDETRASGLPPTSAHKTGVLHAPTPPAVPGARTLTTPALVNLMTTGSPVVINVLDWSEGAFAIPGTKWIPGLGAPAIDALQARAVLGSAQPDKAAPLVFYCLSWECWLSYNAALTALQLGYRNVYWYRGGLQAWNQAALPVLRTGLFGRVEAASQGRN